MWNVPYVNIFIPAWIVPPIYHGIRRESVRSTKSGDELGVKACRPAWFEDESVARLTPTDAAQRPAPMHGLRLYFLCTTTTQTNQGTQNQKRKDVNDIYSGLRSALKSYGTDYTSIHILYSVRKTRVTRQIISNANSTRKNESQIHRN